MNRYGESRASCLARTRATREIARAWPVIYQANLDTIGDDPGLILPGQHLTIPQGRGGVSAEAAMASGALRVD